MISRKWKYVMRADDLEKMKICDDLREKVTYVGKMNFEFCTKLGRGHPYQHVPEENQVLWLTEPGKRAYKVRILKNVLLRK